MPSRIYHWKPDWLEKGINGVSFRTWCRKVKGENTFVHCILCDSQFDIGSSGSWGLKSHALTKRHLNAVDRSNSRRPVAAVSRKAGAKDHRVSEDISAVKSNGPDLSKKTLSPLVINVFTQGCQTPADVNKNWCGRKGTGGDENKFIEVYICFYCAEEFPLRSSLHAHQSECVMRPPDLQAITPPSKAAQVCDAGDSPPCLSRSQTSLSPSMTVSRPAVRDSVMEPSKDSYMSMLGLLPKTKAAQVCQKRRRRNTECETLDLDEEIIPMTPTLPRTPKCLLSHLSREGSDVSPAASQSFSFRRQLSFNSQSHKSEETEDKKEEEKDDPQGSQKVAERKSMGKTKSLYNIDLSSLLGQVVIKHFKGDPSLHVLSDIESHCLTSSPKKSVLSSRPLRARHLTYHVTFKGYSMKRTVLRPGFFHEYKFTRRQRREFMKCVNSGLDKFSRVLRRQMKPCSVELKYISKADLRKWIPSQNSLTVDLKPLTTAEIAYWTTSKSEPNMDNVAVFPKGLTFSSPNVENILGLRTRQKVAYVCLYRLPLSIANYVSEEMFAEVTQNRKTVYKSLLSDSLIANTLPKLESSPSILRKMLTSPVVGVNNIHDIRNLRKNHSIEPGTCNRPRSGSSPSGSSETGQCRSSNSRTSSIVDELGGCSFLSNVNRDMSFSAEENFSQNFASRKKLLPKRKNETVSSVTNKPSSNSLKPKHNIWLRLSNSGEKIKKREEPSPGFRNRPKLSRKLIMEECYDNSGTKAVNIVGPPHKKLRTWEGQNVNNGGSGREHETKREIVAIGNNMTTGVKRKRGRPRKHDSSVSVSHAKAQPCLGANEKITRKVGKPRKCADSMGVRKKTTIGLLKTENGINKHEKRKRGRPEKGASAFARRLSAAGLVPRDTGEKHTEETSFSSSSSFSSSLSKCWGKNLFEQFSTLLHCGDEDRPKDLSSSHQRENANRPQVDASKNIQVNTSEKKASFRYSKKGVFLPGNKNHKTKATESVRKKVYPLPRQVSQRKHRIRKVMSVLKQAEERKSVLTAFVDNFNSRKHVGGSFHASRHNLRGRKKAQKREYC